MQNHLNQLIEDMHLAATRVPQSKIPEDEFDEDYMMELEEMEHQPMSMLFGLTIEQFPSSDKLTSEQLTLMATEFEQLWEAYSFNPNFPEGLPARRRYELMREEIDMDVHTGPAGHRILSFAPMNLMSVLLGKNSAGARILNTMTYSK